MSLISERRSREERLWVSLSSHDLVLWSAATGMDEWKGSLAKAELARQQTKAIQDFNRASTWLAWIMIAVAVVQILVAVLKK